MKKILLFIFLLMIAALGNAQEIEWQNTIGGNGPDEVFSIQQTTDGGYILGGYSKSNISGDKTENCIGDPDYWIIKIDASGNIQWQNTIGGGGTDYLFSIQQTIDRGYILGGYSNSNISGDKAENCIGNYDYWIVKTDSSGFIQWQNTIGGSGNDYLYSIHQTSDGSYILGGYSDSNISGDKTENSNGYLDYWIVKTDLLGNIQWQNTIGGSSSDELHSLMQTIDGGYILGGFSNSSISGDKTENSNDYDYWIIKTDSFGNIQWQKTIGGSYPDELYSIQQTVDGGYILGGNRNYVDYWIIKTDSAGNIQWQRIIGGDANDNLYSIDQTADEGYILGGLSQSNISRDKTENRNGAYDYWIVKTDATGNIQWQNTIGGVGFDNLNSIKQTVDGGYIVAGYSNSNISGDKTENINGGYDYWLLKITGIYNIISGKLFIDTNTNNSQDVGEPAVLNRRVTEVNSDRFSFTQNEGLFYLSVLDTGNFSVSPSAFNYYNPVPANHTAYFSAMQQTDSSNDFAFQSGGIFNDLCITLTPPTSLRQGFNSTYVINYTNMGTTILSPTVTFYIDTNVSYVSANPFANLITTDSMVWNFGPLAPYQTGCILVTVQVDLGTPLGTLVSGNVIIEPISGDADSSCNQDSWEAFTGGSFDPNEILVSRDALLSTEVPSAPMLDYIIYFQNTGNDTAFNVKVLNPIDTSKLQLSTFDFVASSHPANITWKPWERNFEFKFDNILLPDSNVDEPRSHGFIRYRIKPKTTLTTLDTIKNTAYIYFDFNAPIQTNVAITRIVLPTDISTATSQAKGIHIYPNPAHDKLYVECKLRNARLEITDVAGRTAFSKILNQKLEMINLNLSSGLYFVKVSDGEKMFTQKLVIE
jgi:hypothetical protein